MSIEQQTSSPSLGAEPSSTCPECSGDLAPHRDETICEECGLVVAEDHIDHGPEWRALDDDTDPKRTGAPQTETLHDRGLSTQIGHGGGADDAQFSGRSRQRVHRLRRAASYTHFETSADRVLAHGLAQVRRIAGALDLGDSMRDQACSLFRQAQDAGLLRGRSLDGLAGATVYAVCRCNQLPRTRSDVLELVRAPDEQFGRAYDALNQELGLPTPPPEPTAFVARLASDLDVPDRTRKRARDLADAGGDAGLASGANPAGFAAGCLYQAGQDTGAYLTQATIADVADVTTQTLRGHARAVADLDV